jgi:hypothetical protein
MTNTKPLRIKEYPTILSSITLLQKPHNKMKSYIPTILFTACSIAKTRTFLSTHWLTVTWNILLARLVFPISNSFPYCWVTSRLPRIFKLPCFASLSQQPWPRWHVLVLAQKLIFKKNFLANKQQGTHKGC